MAKPVSYPCVVVEHRLWRTHATLTEEGNAAFTVNYSLYQEYGAEITLSDDPSGSNTGEGRVIFSNVPDFFTYARGTTPTSANGSWKPGTTLFSQPGLVISFPEVTFDNSPNKALLLAEGNPSSPTLVCDVRETNPSCTFTKA
jgi:hypothetical protein